jgi:predicted transcriptional regulator
MTRCELISSEGTKNACAQLDEEQDVLSALKVMYQAGVNHLLVSRSEGEPVGVVSALEIIRLLGR